MIQVGGFFGGGQRLQPLPVNKIAAVLGDRQITDPQGGNVLEKMGPLGGIGFQIIGGGFNDPPDAGDVMPIYRYAEPAVGRAPAARADQQVFTLLLHQLVIDPADSLTANSISTGHPIPRRPISSTSARTSAKGNDRIKIIAVSRPG